MFNKNEFMAEIARRGLKVSDVAELLNINAATLYRKLNGENDFLRHEIEKLRTSLKLSDLDVLRIFFA